MQVSWLFVLACSSVRVAPWYTSLRTCRCFVSFYCWGCGQLFSLPIWVRRVAALVSLLRRHGGVVLFGERGARCSSAADSVPASLSGWGGSSAARFFFSCIGFFGGRLLAASTGGFASRVLLPAQRFVISAFFVFPVLRRFFRWPWNLKGGKQPLIDHPKCHGYLMKTMKT